MFKPLFSLFLSLAFLLVPTSCEHLEKLGITQEEIISGLREALTVGANSAASQLGVTDGYFGNQALKLLLPPEAKPVLDNISRIPGGQSLLDDVILKMNRGAEKAALKAGPIFVNAITGMTLTDGKNILMGSDTSATHNLRQNTFSQLTNAFAPEINSAMDEIGAASAWNTLFSNYNTVASSPAGILLNLQPVEANLGAYATSRALSGLFVKIAEQEKLIRDDPARRTSDLLKKVFAEQDNK